MPPIYHNGSIVDRVFHGGVEAEYVLTQGKMIFPEPDPRLPFDIGNRNRVVDDGNEKWFEFGWVSPELLNGNAVDGWEDPGGYCRIRAWRSEDLVTWDNDVIESPNSPEATGDGAWIYWARCKYPVDSVVKTGQMWAESGPGNSPDTRNNPFTSLVINNVTRALGGFPYTMPGDAARMQADMRANGLAGATCVASSATVWRIDIPNVNYTQYSTTNRVGWPGYLIADMFGNLTITVDDRGFTGQFVNTAGVRTALTKQFGRFGLSLGSRYDT